MVPLPKNSEESKLNYRFPFIQYEIRYGVRKRRNTSTPPPFPNTPQPQEIQEVTTPPGDIRQ